MRVPFPVSCALAAALLLSCKGGGSGDDGNWNFAGGMAGAGGSDAGIGGSAGEGGAGGTTGTECQPEMMRDCYSGPPGTANIGACTVGSETCNEQGSDWGECIGEVLPSAEVPTEPGEDEVDEDCDGMVDEPPDA